jgi:hypothetical protein
MPTLPADEDYARALLSIFAARHLLPMQSLRRDDVQATFLTWNMGREADFDAALEYAIIRGWLWAGFGSIRLTGPGDEEMQTIWEGRGLGSEPDRRGPPAPSLPVVKPSS